MGGLFQGYDIAMGLVSIMIAASGIIIGLGTAIDDRKLKELGRSELYQAIINGVIVGALFVAFSPGGLATGLINSMSANVSAGSCAGTLSQNYAICFAHNFLVGLSPITVNNRSYPTIMDSALGVLTPAIAIYSIVSFIASIKLSAVVVSVSFNAMLQPVLNLLNYVISAMSMTLASLEVQGILLEFIAGTALPVLLPIGLVLRTFYFTRRLGGAIIAITIALFAVFPLTYVLDAQLVASYSTSNSNVLSSVLANSTQAKANITGSLSANMSDSVLTGLSNGVTALSSYVEQGIGSFSSMVAMIIVEAFLLPAFSIILTVISARELAKIFGSEISFGKFDIF